MFSKMTSPFITISWVNVNLTMKCFDAHSNISDIGEQIQSRPMSAFVVGTCVSHIILFTLWLMHMLAQKQGGLYTINVTKQGFED